ncbi:MAG: hypothetical protein FE834_07055 [Gammaproteobacteria bacterium]|nr:hypothetical protein [Gammaproteobacteria bacterium]
MKSWNKHASRNYRLFGKNWSRISGIYFIGLFLGTFALVIENSHKAQELAIQSIQEQGLQYASARLIIEKKSTNKPHFFIITKDKKKHKFNDYIYKKKNPHMDTYLQLIHNNADIKVAYISFPYIGFFEIEKLFSLKTKDNMEIIKFAEVKKEVLNRYPSYIGSKYIYFIGIFLLLFAVAVLPIRYYLYGFDGVDKLIKIKYEELKRYGKFIHEDERYMSEEDILSGKHQGEIEIKKENRKWL